MEYKHIKISVRANEDSRAIRFSFGSCDGRSQALGHMTVVVIDLNQDIEYRPPA